MEYIARFDKDGIRSQSIHHHLEQVAAYCAENCCDFTEAQIGEVLGWLHDIGKYTEDFQRRVRNEPIHTQHAIAGAAECERLYQKTKNYLYRLLSYCIAGHHAGLPDWGSESGFERELARKLKIQDELIGDYSAWKTEIEVPSLPNSYLPFQPSKYLAKHFGFAFQMYTRFLFSALVDADRTDAQGFEEQNVVEAVKKHLSLAEMEAIYTEKTEAFRADAEETYINQIRDSILDDCYEAAKGEKGFYSLSVPTGGGKTRSSLGFALRHGVMHKMKRIIYSIPFTSIIEQNAEVYRELLGDDNVLEHHCNFENPYRTDASEEEMLKHKRLLLAQENYESPLIVTTNVQFFESLFSNKPSRVRKLHNYANSVIILDEVQAIPNEYIKPCMYALTELVEHYGCTVVLCTATQPEFAENGLLPEHVKVKEIISNKAKLFADLKRTKGCFLGQKTVEEIGAQLREQKQVLCVVNTKRHALDLFAQLDAKDEANFYLTTNMMPCHRIQVIEEIRRRLHDKLPCRVVSTQLIEAGVDVDFPVVYRSLTGIDSIIQAAGRCNREGKNPVAEVFVFEPEPAYACTGYLGMTAALAKGIIQRFPEDFLGEKAVHAYFVKLFDFSGDNVDSKNILKEDPQLNRNFAFDFQTIAENFRLIDSQGFPVVILNDETNWNGESKEVCKQLKKAEFAEGLGGILRELSKHCVNVRPNVLDKMKEAGVLKTVADEILVLTQLDWYREKTGLTMPEEPNEIDYIV